MSVAFSIAIGARHRTRAGDGTVCVPYGLILLFASTGLPLYFVVLSSAPSRMKWLVGALACVCVTLVLWFPRLVIIRTLLQLIVCLVVLVYLKVHPYGV